MEDVPYQPSEAWKKFHEKYKLIEPAKEPDGEYYWEKMCREEIEQEQMDAEDERYFREMDVHNRCYEDDESIMNRIMNGEGDRMGY